MLGDGEPTFAQQSHYPPVEPSWPYEPPKHAMWIERFKDTAVLMIALFGQVLGGVPLNAAEAPFDLPSAWMLDPLKRQVHRSTPDAMHIAHAALVVERAGGTSVAVLGEKPFLYIPDGPDGPVKLPVELPRADSISHAFELLTDADEPAD